MMSVKIVYGNVLSVFFPHLDFRFSATLQIVSYNGNAKKISFYDQKLPKMDIFEEFH